MPAIIAFYFLVFAATMLVIERVKKAEKLRVNKHIGVIIKR